MIGILMGLGLPARAAKLASWGIIALALVAVLWWLRSDAYRDGVRATNAKWEQRIAADKAAQAQRERVADQQYRAQRVKDTAAAQQRKAQIDEATRNLPDESPSARARARICIDLMRQGKASPDCSAYRSR